jgi:hypothetical protein
MGNEAFAVMHKDYGLFERRAGKGNCAWSVGAPNFDGFDSLVRKNDAEVEDGH